MRENAGLSPIKDISLHSIKKAEDKRKSRIRWSWILLGAGLLGTVLLALLGVVIPSLSIIAAACLTLVAGIFQVLSIIVASGAEVDAAMARQQLLNGLNLSNHLNELRKRVEHAYEQGTSEERRRALGEVSAAFVHLQDSAELGVYGWIDVRPDLLLSIDIDEQPSSVEE